VRRLAAYGEPVEGTPFGRYRLIELLGRGGMGEVWRAFDTATNRVVAVKVLPAKLADDPQFEQRFRREAFAAAGLANPHVVPIHNFGEIDGRLYVDMRLIEGRDLQNLLADGPLQPPRAASIIEQVASALHAAHRVGLVHRDVKPSNILVDEEDFAYLIDFGIARAAGETSLTSTGNVIGTWAYMAPERLTKGQTDARADIYALACVLHECLTGSQPFPANSLEQQLAAHLAQPPPRPSALQDTVPTAMDTVVAKGMAKDPDERFQTAKELATAARAATTTYPGSMLPTEPVWHVAREPGPAPVPRAEWPVPHDNPETPSDVSPVALTRLRGPRDSIQQWPGPTGQPAGQEPPSRAASSKKVLWGAIAAGIAVIAVVAILVLVTANRDHGAGSVSATTSSTPPPNTGPFTGTFSADFGPPAHLVGTPLEGTPQKETWNLRSVCGARGCVATASRASGTASFNPTLVFDDVGGRWLAVGVIPKQQCLNKDVEVWEVFSLQPRPDGTLTGEYTTIGPAQCDSQRTVTFTRTGDVRVDLLNDPASLPARVASPAQALHGRYHDTVTAGGSTQEGDFSVRTDCLRSGDSCMSYLYRPETVKQFVFADRKWSWNTEYDAPCTAVGTSHIKVTADYPLPQQPQDPIAVLTGHGQSRSTGACAGGDFDEKFVRIGD
jgi:serine/threonine protein kinase